MCDIQMLSLETKKASLMLRLTIAAVHVVQGVHFCISQQLQTCLFQAL